MIVNSADGIMEKSSSQEQPAAPSLKCPRCDSTNTKFCYYNNYSLSQPRHFCKACKRYWTRGGTLRNVPVGGGCRKNKRVKRTASATTDGISLSSSAVAEPQSANPGIPGQAINPLLFGVASNPSEMNPPFSRFSMHGNVSDYGLQGQVNNLDLGFSSGVMSSDNACESYIQNRFDSSKNIQDLFAPKSVISSYLGNSSCHTSTYPSMASLLSSTIQQQRFMNPDTKEASNNFQDIGSQIAFSSEAKDVKLGVQNMVECNLPYHNQVDQHNGLIDSSLSWNSTTNIGSWHDLANMCSGVSSLI